MESSATQIERLIHEKIDLYQDLVQVLDQEKKSLRETDVDALWRFSEEKQAIAAKIKTVRQAILAVLNRLKINHGMDDSAFRLETVLGFLPEETEKGFTKELLILNSVKNKIHDTARVNKAFVEEYLNVLDEMIGIIANAGNPEAGYTKSCASEAGGKANLLLHKEV